MFYREQRGSANKATKFREVRIDFKMFCGILLKHYEVLRCAAGFFKVPKDSQGFLGGSGVI